MRPLTLALLALAVSACSRATDATTLPPQSAAERPAYVAPSVTPPPPPTWTPHIQMTEQAVAATAIYLRAAAQDADHQAALYAITEESARLIAASSQTEAAARAEQAIAERDAAQAGATATAGMIREHATADTAYIRTALPPRATQVAAEAQAAQRWEVLPGVLGALAFFAAMIVLSVYVIRSLLAENRKADDHAHLQAQRAADLEEQRAKTYHLYGAPAPVVIPNGPPAPSYVERAIKINGYSPGEIVLRDIVDARERCWRLAGVRALEWADRLGGISQPRMLVANGGPFASAEDWQHVTDFLAQNGYIVKPGNGKRTQLAPAYQTWRAAALALADVRRSVTYDRQSDPVPVEAPDHSPTHAPAPARV
mgnify:CR=1 FL=1